VTAGVEIDGTTRICGVIGDPVSHSVSPAMHNAAFRALRLNYAYLPFNVSAAGLARAVDGIRALNLAGMNVTIPHKMAVIPLLDEIEPLALRIGAVNVIHNTGGRLIGGNTDAEGLLRLLKERDVDARGLRTAVLGAGGASRAVCFALASIGAHITVINRTAGRAADLAAEMTAHTGSTFESLEMNPANLAMALSRADLVINATSVGMVPDAGKSPVRCELLGPRHIVVDIIYNPVKTRLMKDAEKAGAMIIGGLDMLAWQGALSLEIWTGCEAPIDVMRRAAAGALRSYEK
jgi:shikimate dehydrogenase